VLPVLALSFESVDPTSAASAADLVRHIRMLADGAVVSCDVGADSRSRYLGVCAELRSDPPQPVLDRLVFWVARARGQARLLGSADADAACAFRARLARCAYFQTGTAVLHASAAIRAIFRREDIRPTPSGAPLDTPILSLCVGGPALEGASYDASRRELFIPSPLALPVGDECVVQLEAPWQLPVCERARVVAHRTADGKGPAASGFVLALRDGTQAAHRLLVACLTPTGGSYARRRSPRHRLHGPARVRSIESDGSGTEKAPPSHPAFLRDLSAGGAFIRTKGPYVVGDRVQLEAILPNRAQLRTLATVVHTRTDGIGLRFETTPEGDDGLAGAVAGLTGRRRRVLLVDDDALAREMLGDAFREGGYEVVTAPDATVGLQALTDQLFTLDLLVTDVLMSGVDGEDLVRTIRTFGGETDLPILVVTGSLHPEVCARLRELGANDVVAKSEGARFIVAVADGLLAPRGSAAPVSHSAAQST